MYYGLPTRRPKERPKELPLKVRLTAAADWTFINVRQEVYPFLILFPFLDLPGALTGSAATDGDGATVKRLWIRGASFRDGLLPHLEALCAELKVAAIEPGGTVDTPAFFRMLAKIAHGFAVAELGPKFVSPNLIPIIDGTNLAESKRYIGGHQNEQPPSTDLHEVSFVSCTKDPHLVLVRIRLFAILGTPTYLIAAGRHA